MGDTNVIIRCKSFNWTQGTSAAVVGAQRSRIRQVIIFADAAGALQ